MYKITFDLCDEESENYISKHFGYAKTDFNLKRNTCFKVRFDGNKRYPVMIEAETTKYLKGT